jgi:hypothetical protein
LDGSVAAHLRKRGRDYQKRRQQAEAYSHGYPPLLKLGSSSIRSARKAYAAGGGGKTMLLSGFGIFSSIRANLARAVRHKAFRAVKTPSD